MNNRTVDRRVIIYAVICLAAAVLSYTLVATYFSSAGFLDPIMESLETKRQDVLELTAASTGASIGISALPGDLATPIAEKMANISQYLLIVMCAIYLEKYIMAIMGYVVFKILLPASFVMLGAGTALRKSLIRNMAVRIMAFGLVMFAVIPLSVRISDVISDSYRESMEATIESAEELSQTESPEAETETEVQEEDPSLWEQIMDIPSTVAETASEAVTGAADVTQEKIEELQVMLNNFMESVAVMIITSCVIPILVLLFFIYFIKMIFSAGSGNYLK